MEPPGGRDSRFNLGYSMNMLSGETPPEIYGNPGLGRPSTSLQQLSPRHTTMVSSACGGGRTLKSDVCYDERGMPQQAMSGGGAGGTSAGMDACGVNDIGDDTYGALQSKKSPPSNGKKTKGRVKIKMEYIENKLRRYTTFSKRKTGIMKKAYELSTLTGTQVMLLVASETGHVYTFATRKLQPMITSEAGKALIQTCLNSPDPPAGSASGDQRMSATGFEETELTYNISDEDSKDENMSAADSSDSSDNEGGDLEPADIKPKLNGTNNATSTSAQQSASVHFQTAPNKNVPPISTPSPSAAPSSSSSAIASITLAQSVAAAAAAAASAASSPSSSTQQSKIESSTQPQTTSIISPLMYQTPQGMMYATPSNGGVIFSLAPQGDANGLAHPPQFITIPLSVMTANGQGELDLSKRK